jgi:segregation and condensation protein A
VGLATAGAAPCLVLDQFEGPLDLLLHLIRTSEISITDVPIVQICRQYDDYLSLMREMDLEVAGEYLVMAATLAHIKSRMLLPAPPAAVGEAIEDPRADLVRQLLEYQRIKAAAERLRDLDEAQADGFVRGNAGEDPLALYRGERYLEVSLFDLLAAFKHLVESLGDAAPLRVQRDEVSVAEKIAWILDKLESAASVSFQSLISELSTRAERIATFLAVLELVRLRLVAAAQHRPGAEILLQRPAPEPADIRKTEAASEAGERSAAAPGRWSDDEH